MKNYLFLAAICLASIPAHAQQHALKAEILNYRDTTEEILEKADKLLMRKLEQGQLEKVKEIKDYLLYNSKVRDKVSYRQEDYALVLYWTQGYKELLVNTHQTGRRGCIVYDNVFLQMRPISIVSKQTLVSLITASTLTNEEKDFLQMKLTFLLMGYRNDKEQDTLNNMADDFLSKYPGSMYEGQVRKDIRHKMRPSFFRICGGLATGAGILTGSISKDYKHIAIPFGIWFDAQHNNWALALRNGYGGSSTRRPLKYGDSTWLMGSTTDAVLFEAALGYAVADNRRFRFTPHAGIAAMGIVPYAKDKEKHPFLKTAGFRTTTTYSLGISADIKFANNDNIPRAHFGEEIYGVVRIRYMYCMPQYQLKNKGQDGNIHTITVGVGLSSLRYKKAN